MNAHAHTAMVTKAKTTHHILRPTRTMQLVLGIAAFVITTIAQIPLVH